MHIKSVAAMNSFIVLKLKGDVKKGKQPQYIGIMNMVHVCHFMRVMHWNSSSELVHLWFC